MSFFGGINKLTDEYGGKFVADLFARANDENGVKNLSHKEFLEKRKNNPFSSGTFLERLYTQFMDKAERLGFGAKDKDKEQTR